MKFVKTALLWSLFLFIVLSPGGDAFAYERNGKIDNDLKKIETMLNDIQTMISGKEMDDKIQKERLSKLKLELFTLEVIQDESLKEYFQTLKYGDALQKNLDMLYEVIKRLEKYEPPQKVAVKKINLEECKIIKYSNEELFRQMDETMLGINQVRYYINMVAQAAKNSEIDIVQKKNLLEELNQEFKDTSAYIQTAGDALGTFIDDYKKINDKRFKIAAMISELSKYNFPKRISAK